MKSRYQETCTNCKASLEKQFLFQGLVICEKCNTIVTHLVHRAENEMKMMFLTYTDMLRVAIVKGELNFPVLPAETRMPRREMEGALRDISRKLGGLDDQVVRSTTQGKGEVSGLRNNTSGSDGTV